MNPISTHRRALIGLTMLCVLAPATSLAGRVESMSERRPIERRKAGTEQRFACAIACVSHPYYEVKPQEELRQLALYNFHGFSELRRFVSKVKEDARTTPLENIRRHAEGSLRGKRVTRLASAIFRAGKEYQLEAKLRTALAPVADTDPNMELLAVTAFRHLDRALNAVFDELPFGLEEDRRDDAAQAAAVGR